MHRRIWVREHLRHKSLRNEVWKDDKFQVIDLAESARSVYLALEQLEVALDIEIMVKIMTKAFCR